MPPPPRTHWAPYTFFTPSAPPFALIILNQDLKHLSDFRALWTHAAKRICADGGANRLFDALQPAERNEFLPEAIIGDLDSLRADVSAFYAARNVLVNRDPDQYSTDFGKCVAYIEAAEEEQQKMPIVALGGFGGRVDQSFHSIHVLFTARPRELYLVTDEDVTFLLKRGENVVSTPLEYLGPTCGVVPVGGRAVVTLVGFEWDLEETEMGFGGLVSTSNHLVGDEVKVVVDGEGVVFTVALRR